MLNKRLWPLVIALNFLLQFNCEPPGSQCCQPDINHDGIVNLEDLTQCIISWEENGADTNCDGQTNVYDLLNIIIYWNEIMPVSATITMLSAPSRMAPHTVFVHARSSDFNGSAARSECTWDFGDPSGAIMCSDPRPGKGETIYLNDGQRGFSAAYIYEADGEYTITLTVKDSQGNESVDTTNVTITADTRAEIYVSSAGSDETGDGSIGNPYATPAKGVSEIAGNGTKVLMNRGDDFTINSTLTVTNTDVVLGAYGTGNRPILRHPGPGDATYEIINPIGQNCVIRDLKFDSDISTFVLPQPAPGDTDGEPNFSAIDPHQNGRVTVRDCIFGSENGYFELHIKATSGPTGMLFFNNRGEGRTLRQCWKSSDATDHNYIGNTWTKGSVFEHGFRLGVTTDVVGCTVAYNYMDQEEQAQKGWRLQGIGYGRCRWNQLINGGGLNISFDDRSCYNTIVDGNYIDTFAQACILLYHNTQEVMIKNNVLHCDANAVPFIKSDIAQNGPTDSDGIYIINNTMIRPFVANHGRFAQLSRPEYNTNNQFVYNNLWSAHSSFSSENEEFITGSVGTYQNNVYEDFGSEYTYVVGFANWQAWLDASKTTNEQRETTTQAELASPNFRLNSTDHPIATSNGVAYDGVFEDYHGTTRPGGSWYVGAVDAAPASGGGSSVNLVTTSITNMTCQGNATYNDNQPPDPGTGEGAGATTTIIPGLIHATFELGETTTIDSEDDLNRLIFNLIIQ